MTNGTAARGTDSRTRPTASPGCAETSVERSERLSNAGSRALDEPPPRVGQRHAARRAREQHHAQLLLELPHRLAHRGRRDAELARRGAEAAQARHGEEHLELREGRRVQSSSAAGSHACIVKLQLNSPSLMRLVQPCRAYLYRRTVGTPRRARRGRCKSASSGRAARGLGHRPRLHGHELRLRPAAGQAGDDRAHPRGRRARRHVLRHGRSLRPVHERGARRRGARARSATRS